MKIAFFETKNWEESYLRKRFPGHAIFFHETPLTVDTASKAKDADAVVVFIYSHISKEILAKLQRLKLVATKSTGFDHIDLKECKKRKITVCNVPNYGENTVAEHTFALILSLSRNVHKSYVRTLRNDFSTEGLKGFDLAGKTLGVIGAGHIGLHVVRIARGFGMRVLVYDVHHERILEEVLGFTYVSLDDLMARSDIITLHVPYNEHTHHLIDREKLKRVKRGAILINTSRGKVVDTRALLEALDNKTLAGAGLDVLEGEELIKDERQVLYDAKNKRALADLVRDHILLSRDNVVFTPHIAFYSQEALERILETTIQNVLAYSHGKPQNTVY